MSKLDDEIRERQMVVAHQIGRDHARHDLAHQRANARVWFNTKDERDSFEAGYIGELKRLAKPEKVT